MDSLRLRIYRRFLRKKSVHWKLKELKVSEGNLHIRKIEKFSQFMDMLNLAIIGVKGEKDPKALIWQLTKENML